MMVVVVVVLVVVVIVEVVVVMMMMVVVVVIVEVEVVVSKYGDICEDDQVIGEGAGTQKHRPKPTSMPQSLSSSGIALRGCALPRPQLKTPWAPPPLDG
jgi:hypothetical protein